MNQNSAHRFTHTVEHYARYRPHYPLEILSLLKSKCGLTADQIVADIGSGTGILTKLFLENGNTVYGVEPNAAMRHQAEQSLQTFPKFISVNATAEATHLPVESVDFVTAGTAFHWFDYWQTKKEFQRILKRAGWVVLIWNVRNIENPLVSKYEQLLLKFLPDYKQKSIATFEKSVEADFFEPMPMFQQTFVNQQTLDWSGFLGRLLSTSYCIPDNHRQYPQMIAELKNIFESYQQEGLITFDYLTKVYYGQLT